MACGEGGNDMKKTTKHAATWPHRILTRTLAEPIQPLSDERLAVVIGGGVGTFTPGYEVDDYDLDGRW